MIGVVIVTHGRLAAELLAAWEHVMGPQEAVRIVCVGADDDLTARRHEVSESIIDVGRDAGVIVVTDLIGGTPSNLCTEYGDDPGVAVIGGVNLPMLVKLALVRRTATLCAAVKGIIDAGQRYMGVALQTRNGERRVGDSDSATSCGHDGRRGLDASDCASG